VELAAGVELLKRERLSWEAEIPVDELARAGFPSLVISGDHSEAFEAVCDALADGLGAERGVIPGRGHTVPSTGEPYNRVLERHLAASERKF
jgi:pimeloyl-ACP methyl ester carboxylesterase